MIAAVTTHDGLSLEARLPAGATAYVDADWIPEGGGAVPALVVAGGALGRLGGDTTLLPPGADGDRAAAEALASVVAEALAAVADAGPFRVAVTGAGAVAHALRTALRSPEAPDAPIDAVIEASGDPAALQAATERLPDLGLLVLAGEPAGRAAPFDLYPHLHLRGLRAVGIAPASGGRASAQAAVVDALLAELADAPAKGPLPPARWYRLRGSA